MRRRRLCGTALGPFPSAFPIRCDEELVTTLYHRSQWTKLKDEYLQHQKHMKEISLPESEQSLQTSVSSPQFPNESKPVLTTSVSDLASTKRIQSSAPLPTYPIGCLVFVKNVHPETNKTALRELFSAALKNKDADQKMSQIIDYVDYTKGLETVRGFSYCYEVRTLIIILFMSSIYSVTSVYRTRYIPRFYNLILHLTGYTKPQAQTPLAPNSMPTHLPRRNLFRSKS